VLLLGACGVSGGGGGGGATCDTAACGGDPTGSWLPARY
jgi:hypothetical protein